MSVLTRRRLLQVSGVSVVSVGAGCVSLQRLASDEVRLERLKVVNADSTAYTVHVMLTDEDEPVYFDSQEIESRTGDEVDAVTFNDFPEDDGAYTIYAWLDDQRPAEWSEFDVTERDSCTRITITIGGSDRTSDVEIRSTDGCPDADSDS